MTSINGFPVSANPAYLGVRNFRVPGTTTYLPVRSDIAPLLIGFADEFNRTVQPLHQGWCWGYSYRNVRGYTVPSYHSAGIAIDLNAPIHPLGRTGTFSSRQREQINILCRKYGLRWGGNYNGRKDEMHFEVVLSQPAAVALAHRIQYGSVTHKFPYLAQMKLGAKNRSVRALQAKLRAEGYHPGTIDGRYGPKTRAAVRAFQLAQGWHGSDADGLVGPGTYRKLWGRAP